MKTAQEHEEAAREAREQATREAREQTGGNNGNGDKPRFKAGHSLAWYANQAIDHEQTLLGNRYLCRGGGMFVIAPSGTGKSTLSLQMAILWCCGLVAFGIKPRKALRILIVQSEDDQGDCTEMAAMKDYLQLTEDEERLVDENTELIRCNDLVSFRFIEALKHRLSQAKDDGKPFDLVIINPYGVYLGTDVKDTEACTRFLNEWLNPLLTEFEIGVILIHHTPKTNFQNTDNYKIWDWMYWGAGAACISNWARAMLALKPETEDMTVFRFIAAKRGMRIGAEWKDAFEKYFSWSKIPGVLRWEEATAEEAQKAISAKSKMKFANLDTALKQVPLLDPELKATVIQKIQAACQVGEKKAVNALNELIATGRAFDVPIPNNGKRSFAGVSKTAKNEEVAQVVCP